MIPLFHDFSDERVLIFGGGRVGSRKARRFSEEAEVVVVSPTFDAGDFGSSTCIRTEPDERSVESWIDRVDPALVVAATDDETLNEHIEKIALERSLLVNRADRPGSRPAGSVIVPATVDDDPVTIAISTDGVAPALSKFIRQRFEDEFEGVGEMATLIDKLKRELKDRSVPEERRREIVTDTVNSTDVWTALRTETAIQSDVIEEVLQSNSMVGGDRS